MLDNIFFGFGLFLGFFLAALMVFAAGFFLSLICDLVARHNDEIRHVWLARRLNIEDRWESLDRMNKRLVSNAKVSKTFRPLLAARLLP